MQPKIAICVRCGGMKVGWNKRYMAHWLRCKQSLHKSSKLGGAAIVAVLILGFPTPSASGSSVPVPERPVQVAEATVNPVADEIRRITAFLERHEVNADNRNRLAESIVTSARKYGLNSRLVASIMIVESRGNPFAISGQDAVDIMQIHLPTWGETADRENINLLKIEDNVALAPSSSLGEGSARVLGIEAPFRFARSRASNAEAHSRPRSRASGTEAHS